MRVKARALSTRRRLRLLGQTLQYLTLRTVEQSKEVFPRDPTPTYAGWFSSWIWRCSGDADRAKPRRDYSLVYSNGQSSWLPSISTVTKRTPFLFSPLQTTPRPNRNLCLTPEGPYAILQSRFDAEAIFTFTYYNVIPTTVFPNPGKLTRRCCMSITKFTSTPRKRKQMF